MLPTPTHRPLSNHFTSRFPRKETPIMATHRNGKYEPRHLAPRHSKTARALGPALAPASLALGAVIFAPTAGATEAPTAHVPNLNTATTAATLSTGTETFAPRALDAVVADVDVAGDTDVDPTPSVPDTPTPLPEDPVPTDPSVPEPGPVDPMPVDPTPEVPTNPEQPTDPVVPDQPSPEQPTTPEVPVGPDGGQGGSEDPGKPLEPGTSVDPGTTPVTPVDEGSYVVGAPAPAGSTWVVADQSAPGTYRAVASYQPGAQLARTGVGAVTALAASALVSAGGGLVAASRRRRGAHVA